MSDRVAVMHDGVIVEEGTPYDIYNKPRHGFSAEFVGLTNFPRLVMWDQETTGCAKWIRHRGRYCVSVLARARRAKACASWCGLKT